MAAPVGNLTIKFNSIKFNSLGLLLDVLANELAYLQYRNDTTFAQLVGYNSVHDHNYVQLPNL